MGAPERRSEKGFEGWNSDSEGLAEVGGVGRVDEAGDLLGTIAAGCLPFERKLKAFAKKPRFLGDVLGEGRGEGLVWLLGRGAAVCEAAMPLS